MIRVEGLTKRYAQNLAVDHISFEVERGRIVGFLGPNGAGKTTTMRVLTCFMPPTSGLDPRQIMETRDLIKGLAGDHTIILSTHILQEVEAMCEQVIIIAKGQLRAIEPLDNLIARGVGAVDIEISPREGELNFPLVKQVLENTPGVTRVSQTGEVRHNRVRFEVESRAGHDARGDIARAVVGANLNLNELRSGLEKIYLELTGAQPAAAPEEAQA